MTTLTSKLQRPQMHNPYDLIAEQWHANKRDPAYIERLLRYVDKVLEGLAPGAKVLDLGCGTGEPVAAHMLRRGFRLTGVDQSREMLRIAKTVVPEAELIHAEMIEFMCADKYAAAVAWDSMFHVPRAHHATIYRNVANCLEAGARVLFSVGGSESEEASEIARGEGFTSEMFGQTFFYSGWPLTVARNLIQSAGFEIEMWEVDDPNSREHVAVIARKSIPPDLPY